MSATGTPVANAVVTFAAADPAVATLTPAAGTALTNGSGVATVNLNAATATAGGASTISASASVAGTPIANSIGFAVNAAAPAATGATIAAPTFGVAGALSAYGTTSVTANVTPTTTPVTVTFTSTCASANPPKATITASVKTVGGVATASYLDNGCASTDTITASISGTSATASSTLVVTPPVTGSIQYVSATPTNISLQGTGGITASQVVFKVVDVNNQPLSGKVVTFGLSTTAGGIALTPAAIAPATSPTATSDAQGIVSITVNAGTVSTPVRVTASTPGTGGTVLSTQSNQLTVSTGIPAQSSTSLAASTINTEGWGIDGLTSTLTARFSDHFNNPVPDGTAVNFTTEGGSVVASCTTIGGACTSTFTTMNPRPTNGRVTVLAYAVGEESFIDLNGNGVADLVVGANTEMKDANGVSTDMPEAFVDYNENGVFNSATEPYFDFNLDGAYNAKDGMFNGVLCSTQSSAGTCAPAKTIHVRQPLVLTMSSSTPAPLRLFNNANPPTILPTNTSILLPSCSNSLITDTPVATYYVRIVDVNGNAMPAGTTISFATSNGILLSPASFKVLNTSDCNTHSTTSAGGITTRDFPGCPLTGLDYFEVYAVTMQSDATYNAAATPPTPACTNAKTGGLLTVTVTTPGGANMGATTTLTTISVND